MRLLDKLKHWYATDVKARFILRSIVVAFISYALTAFRSDTAISLHDLLYAGIGGAANVVVGLLTPSEPLVGVKALKVAVKNPVKK